MSESSSSRATGGSLEHIPEYFVKPKVVEGLAEAHPVLLIRQMANEILRLRSTPSEMGAMPLHLQPGPDLLALADRLNDKPQAHWTSGEKRTLLGFLQLHVGYHTVSNGAAPSAIATLAPVEEVRVELEDILMWADSVVAALGTEHARKVTLTEARIAQAISKAAA